jgi:HK97 family phage major capsid protein
MSTEIQAVLAELKAALPAKFEELHKRIDRLDQAAFTPPMQTRGAVSGAKALVAELVKNADTLNRSGRVRIEVPSLLAERKATIISTGIINPDREPGVQGGGRYVHRLRDLFRTVPISTGAAFVVRSASETHGASPQVGEGSLKAESAYTFAGATVPVETLAHFCNVSRQAFEDVEGLAAFIDETLIWGLEREVESQLLAGDATSGNLDGLITTAAAFDSTILDAGDGWNRMDLLAAAFTQLREAGFRANFFCVHPRDWFRMVITKDQQDRYLMGDPRSAAEEILWAVPGVISDRIPQGSFLVGDSSKAVIRQRMVATVDMSDSHGDNFVKNIYTLRGEERLALVKMREDAFVTGSLTTSPA